RPVDVLIRDRETRVRLLHPQATREVRGPDGHEHFQPATLAHHRHTALVDLPDGDGRIRPTFWFHAWSIARTYRASRKVRGWWCEIGVHTPSLKTGPPPARSYPQTC